MDWDDQVTELALKASYDDACHLPCPKCSSNLHLMFMPGKKGSICVKCANCAKTVWLEGVRNAPPWANERTRKEGSFGRKKRRKAGPVEYYEVP